MNKSNLQQNPKSKVFESGYINIYSQLNPKEKKLINYKIKYKELEPLWDDSQVYLSKYFKSNTPDNSVILDAGCGNGNYIVDENRERISWAIGIDLDKEATLKNICLDEIKIGDLESLPFEDNSFDAVLSLWVIEHMKNPEKVFSEIHRVLKPHGLFMFATSNKSYIPLKLINILNLKIVKDTLNSLLYGRRASDVFETFYRANDLNTIAKILKDSFLIETLRYNYDPSYTSFNDLFFKLSNTLHNYFSGKGYKFTYSHILGIIRKV